MAVFVLIPVFNRLAHTKQILACLKAQVCPEKINVIVIDDGSTDGTDLYLQQQKDVTTLKGDGNLWWGGAINLGLQYVLEIGHAEDWVAFINNDTVIDTHHIQSMLQILQKNPRSVLGSIVRNISNKSEVLDVGALYNSQTLSYGPVTLLPTQKIFSVDLLSGRGTLFPLLALKKAGLIPTRFCPHYLADYLLSTKVKQQGYQLLQAAEISVYSENDFGVKKFKSQHMWDKYFSIRSPFLLKAHLYFWWNVSSWPQRLTLLPRLLYFFIKRHGKKLFQESV